MSKIASSPVGPYRRSFRRRTPSELRADENDGAKRKIVQLGGNPPKTVALFVATAVIVCVADQPRRKNVEKAVPEGAFDQLAFVWRSALKIKLSSPRALATAPRKRAPTYVLVPTAESGGGRSGMVDISEAIRATALLCPRPIECH